MHNLSFLVYLCSQLKQLLLDIGVLCWEMTHIGEYGGSLLPAILRGKPAGRLRAEEHAEKEEGRAKGLAG